MNDLSHGSTVQPQGTPPATIIPGSVWRGIPTGPWERDDPPQVKIIDAKDGWVRYYLNSMWPDERAKEGVFRMLYEPTGDYATGALLKAKVPRDEMEAALVQMLEAYYYHAGESNFAVRDAAIRRAQLAIGAKVTL